MALTDIYEEILDLDPEIAKSWMIDQGTSEIMRGGDAKDSVNNPSHYTAGGIECIDAMKASMSDEEFQGFLKGNVQKYVWRYREKGKPAQDLRKASWYLDRLIKEIE